MEIERAAEQTLGVALAFLATGDLREEEERGAWLRGVAAALDDCHFTLGVSAPECRP